MGPKKEAKKKGGKAEGPITIDPADFIREETDLPVLGGVSTLDTTLSGDIFNIEELFPEWNDEEIWTDISDNLKAYQVNYPSNIQHCPEQLSISQHLGLKGDADGDKKAKKPPKDFAFDDAAFGEDGSALPRIYIGTDPTEGSHQFLSNELHISFQKKWGLDQLQRKAGHENHASDVHADPPHSASGHRPSTGSGKDGHRPNSKEVKKNVPSRGAKKEGGEEVIAPPHSADDTHVFSEEPNGDEIDALVCHVFRLIARFYPSLVDSRAGAPPFLWRAIYPQLPSGKPCYNKAGKYCVKVFVGGRWRKVTVTDIFPVENGQIMLASSTNPYELWPSILSKAIYTVYSASGYHHSLEDLSFQRKNNPAVSSFLSFALHTLTGWLPSTPCSLKEIYLANTPRLQTILDEISLGGAVVVQEAEIPSEEAIRMLPDDDNENRQRTKKQLRDLLLRKKMEKENLIRDIHVREAIVEKITAALSRPFGEVYFLHAVSANEGHDRIIPILGTCHPDPSDPQSTMFLIRWIQAPMVYSDASDIPGSSPVSYEWVRLRDLCDNYREVYLCGLDSRLRTPCFAEWSWHWGEIPDKVEDGKGKSKKEKEVKPKDKKGADMSTPLGVPFRGQDRGVFPPLLLKIDPQSLSENPDCSYFSISVNIQSDLVQLQGDHESSDKGSFLVPDDAVLVLQEIRTDSEDPLVMRVQLAKEDLSYPINRVTFNIPWQRMPRDPVLFWVRLFTKASVYMSFHSPAPLEVMETKQIWQNTGGHVWELSGTTLPTYANMEQLLFRIPIQLTPSSTPADPHPGDNSVLLFLHTPNRAIYDTLSLVAIDQRTGNSRVLPNINGNCFHLSSSDQITIIARCFHTSLNIPEFSWKVTILSRIPLVPPESKMNCLIATEKGTKQRYYGSYAANNALRIFRDVITADTADFPLALRLSCLPLSDNHLNNINLRHKSSVADVSEHLWFLARIYRKSDRQLLHEYSARSLLQIYLLDRDNLTLDHDNNDHEVDKKGGNKAAKGGGGDKKKKGEVDSVEFIVDVLLDETKMTIPEEWKSRYPFKFRKYQVMSELGDMDEKLNEGFEPCHIREVQFHWQLDVLAGKILRMQHDTYDLERYAAMKNKWEDDAPGRRSRALAGRSYWTTRTAATAKHPTSIDDALVDKLIPDLAEALEKEETVIGQKERKLKFLPLYQEDIQRSSLPSTGELLSNDILEHEKSILQAEIEKWKENAQINREYLMKYTELYRQDTLNRVNVIQEQVSGSYEEAITAWAARESYRADIEKKNESLGYLLQRANEALVKAFPSENEDPKAKKKGKK